MDLSKQPVTYSYGLNDLILDLTDAAVPKACSVADLRKALDYWPESCEFGIVISTTGRVNVYDLSSPDLMLVFSAKLEGSK